MFFRRLKQIHGNRRINTLIIFAKAPVPGQVKTRLGADLGMVEASRIYERVLHQLMHEIKENKKFLKHFYVSGDSEYFQFLYPDIACSLQCEGDLGDRMSNAFSNDLKKSSKVVLIGSDCPMMSNDVIEAAFEALDQNDLVLGPAEDGGYYLIGMKQEQQLFSGMAWSSETVLEETLIRAQKLNLRVSQLEVLRDLDTIADYHFYESIIESITIGN